MRKADRWASGKAAPAGPGQRAGEHALRPHVEVDVRRFGRPGLRRQLSLPCAHWSGWESRRGPAQTSGGSTPRGAWPAYRTTCGWLSFARSAERTSQERLAHRVRDDPYAGQPVQGRHALHCADDGGLSGPRSLGDAAPRSAAPARYRAAEHAGADQPPPPLMAGPADGRATPASHRDAGDTAAAGCRTVRSATRPPGTLGAPRTSTGTGARPVRSPQP
jgi:hypothetical protein